jgi:hypothetical protein
MTTSFTSLDYNSTWQICQMIFTCLRVYIVSIQIGHLKMYILVQVLNNRADQR